MQYIALRVWKPAASGSHKIIVHPCRLRRIIHRLTLSYAAQEKDRLSRLGEYG